MDRKFAVSCSYHLLCLNTAFLASFLFLFPHSHSLSYKYTEQTIIKYKHGFACLKTMVDNHIKQRLLVLLINPLVLGVINYDLGHLLYLLVPHLEELSGQSLCVELIQGVVVIQGGCCLCYSTNQMLAGSTAFSGSIF